MARWKQYLNKEKSESSIDLDLAPMLALMVTLIPIMLLSTAFVQINVIETPLPQAVQKAIEEDRNNKDRNVSFDLRMEENGSFKVELSENGQMISSQLISATSENLWNYKSLRTELIKLKAKHPNTFRLNLKPDKKVKYKDIVELMDQVRKTQEDEPMLYILDEEKKKVATRVLFPDVVFSGILGG